MSDLSNVARPYAQAVFEMAQAEGNLAGWGDQLDFLAMIASNDDMNALLNNPVVSHDQLAHIIQDFCGDSINDHTKNLIKLLVSNDRVAALPDIARIFADKRAEAESIVEADMITATAIDAAQQQAFESALQTKLGRSVKLSFRVDEDLIGGAVIRAGDWVVDGSVKAQLEQLVGAVGN